ncbi:MAG: hypothetical protein HQ542_10365 [Bacteroidia bacterium]|nr:hypothetical protein [Bacteroidia bacterium]
MEDPAHKSTIEKRKKRRNPWTFRVVVILFIWILIYFFFAGPGRILFPSLLISYSSVSDHKNTVHFYGNRIEKALDILWLASITQDSISHFSGDTATDEFRNGVTIFLCESPRQYFHLTWNNSMGSAIMGRIVLNDSRITGNMSQYSAIIHEMYHLYINRKYGYLPSIFSIRSGLKRDVLLCYRITPFLQITWGSTCRSYQIWSQSLLWNTPGTGKRW